EDCPIDFEIRFDDDQTWADPAGELIDGARREQLLDVIAAYYSKGPVADIIGPRGALLRGPSKFRFCLDIPPQASRYYEVGRYLAIPTILAAKGSAEKYLLDFHGIARWTVPDLSIERNYLQVIASRATKKRFIGAIGLPG